MEIINIEARTFEAMLNRFEVFTHRLCTIIKQSESKSFKDWLDNQDVCEILSVSKRTLQAHRDTGRLEYSLIGNKIFYRPEAIKEFLKNSSIEKGGNDGT